MSRIIKLPASQGMSQSYGLITYSWIIKSESLFLGGGVRASYKWYQLQCSWCRFTAELWSRGLLKLLSDTTQTTCPGWHQKTRWAFITSSINQENILCIYPQASLLCCVRLTKPNQHASKSSPKIKDRLLSTPQLPEHSDLTVYMCMHTGKFESLSSLGLDTWLSS